MARGYPRFLFSDPQNTKSEGPFLVQLIFPKKLYRVHWLQGWPGFFLEEIQEYAEEIGTKASVNSVRSAESWLSSQLKNGAIFPTSKVI